MFLIKNYPDNSLEFKQTINLFELLLPKLTKLCFLKLL